MMEELLSQISFIASKNSKHSLEEENKFLKNALTRIAMELMDIRAEVELLKMKENVKVESGSLEKERDVDMSEVGNFFKYILLRILFGKKKFSQRNNLIRK